MKDYKVNKEKMSDAFCREVPSELNLPCHRVVNAQGRLAPGWEEQRLLLQEEGVCFRKNGNVDMTRCLWHYDE